MMIRLVCEGGPEIHPLITKLQPPAALEFGIPFFLDSDIHLIVYLLVALLT